MEEFDAWVTYLFDRPPGRQAERWWDDRPSEWLERYARDDKPVAIAERIRHLFGNAGATLRAYSDEQVGRGLNEIINGGDLYVLPSVPCQRSALHGLGHAHMKAPQQVQAVVDRWLETHPDARQELRDYALAARTGSVM